jgi:nucleoside-diphosphate-sugar epimerase
MNKNISNKTALITGATGFIGTNLTLNLLKNNYKIFAVDNHFSSDEKNVLTIKNFISKNQIDEKYKELEATVQRRLVRILHQR